MTEKKHIELNSIVQKQYNKLDFLEDELENAFQYLKYYMPDFNIPEVYTYISGYDFENPIQLNEKALIIALDLYLGNDHKAYSEFGIPQYVSSRFTKEHICIDCIKEYYRAFFENRFIPKNFLDEIIQNAKSVYFTDIIFPFKEDHLKIGYSKEQLEWCEQNEKNLWTFFIEKNVLYSADYEVIRKFTKDGPFTISISRDAPAKLGIWIGWQIIRSYMEKNPEIKLSDLMTETDSQKILKLSGYKPGK